MSYWDHLLLGMHSAIFGAQFDLFGLAIPLTPVMVIMGFILGVMVGATPGLAGPIALAVALPILISIFGYEMTALLPVLGFMIGIMKGSTIGGAVPAILFNTPGTPDAYMTTLDGHPMAKNGEAKQALKVAHFSSVSGDTFSDLMLFICAPFLAIIVEAYLDLPEKAALMILSLAFIAAVSGKSPAKGIIAMAFGLFVATIGTGEDFYPRLSLGSPALADGLPIAAVVLGSLVLGEIFSNLGKLYQANDDTRQSLNQRQRGWVSLGWPLRKKLLPYILNSAFIGTVVGALPGIGSTLAATMGYTAGNRFHERHKQASEPSFGSGAPQGVAATEAANSAVSGANLIPVLSLGIPGNVAAVFLLLAMDSIGGFNPGPSVFILPNEGTNPELVIAFGLFTAMVMANLLNWVIGGRLMTAMAFMNLIPKHILMPAILLVTMTAIYVQTPSFNAILITLFFGLIGYAMRRLGVPILPFVIAFILARNLETAARQAFSATGADPWFLFSSWTATAFMLIAATIVIYNLRPKKTS
ncbi:MAG TPA: hypothetical protein DE179_00900 [Oceanospirillaceae bacterium]|nr:hypothetical protein [Oceanospirillaceae bacterium]